MRFTEGFSVSIMDACAAGCAPFISDADAIGEVYGGVAHVIPGRPSENKQAWIEALSRVLVDDDFAEEVGGRGRAHAHKYDRLTVSRQFEMVIRKALAEKHFGS
jgi:glycosyltransferase involved in cell wall biosynthesis